MKRFAKPMTDISTTRPAEGSTDASPTPPLHEISIQRLIDDGLIALYREIKNILFLSSKGKLDAASARDLRDHMKLLFDLKAQENDNLSKVTDEELKAQAKAALNDED